MEYHGKVFDDLKSEELYEDLLANIEWKHESIQMFGKTILQPRLTACYGDKAHPIKYAGITMDPLAWSDSLLEIKAKIEELTGEQYTTALLNQYRTGADYMGWHRDNEKEITPGSSIASISLGAERDFLIRNYKSKVELQTQKLESGSLLVLLPDKLLSHEHTLPKRLKVKTPRINVTFRRMLSSK